jgi:predicted TIM-barrel fold metal-dependent hydrolase
MIIDVNAYLGHFAFRQLRHNTAASLVEWMDAKKIDKAVVSSAAAITYRNAQAGNEEVAAEVKRHSDRLVLGTGMPFNYPDPALLKLDVLDASAPDKEKIRWRNARLSMRHRTGIRIRWAVQLTADCAVTVK